MPIFGHRKQQSDLLISTPGPGKLPANQVPAKLRVIAVTPPGDPQPVEAALISGLLLGPFPLQLVQLTAALPPASWPSVGQELAAVADPKNPLNFAVVWGNGDGSGEPTGWRPSNGWDAGPNGTHQQAVAEYLAEQGFFPSDFGPALDRIAPGLSASLLAAAAPHVKVIPGKIAVSLASTGEPAQGVVVSARKLPLPPQLFPSPDASMAWLTLRVTPPDGAPYESTIRFGFRSAERFAALATPGTQLPLRFNPADRAQVTIDLPALGITPL
jgi:hypothetical protein